jgi:radical SAM protein with 4Fe4S-binding SPASM domain
LSHKPRIAAIEATNFCNIQCVMCPRGEPDLMKRRVGHIDAALLDKILAEAEFFESPCWLHWFGEPLMNPAIFELIAKAKTKVPNLGISTNATLLTPERAERLLDTELDTIIIALDGATPETYEKIRKSDRFSYESVRRNAEYFIAARSRRGQRTPHIILSIIEMKENAGETEAFVRLWRELGADEVSVKAMTRWGDQDDTFKDLATEQRRSVLAQPRNHPCTNFWTSMTITWDGRVVPCCYDYDAKMTLGDLKTQTLEEIWNGEAYVNARTAEREGRNFSELCKNCTDAPGAPRPPDFMPRVKAGG